MPELEKSNQVFMRKLTVIGDLTLVFVLQCNKAINVSQHEVPVHESAICIGNNVSDYSLPELDCMWPSCKNLKVSIRSPREEQGRNPALSDFEQRKHLLSKRIGSKIQEKLL